MEAIINILINFETKARAFDNLNAITFLITFKFIKVNSSVFVDSFKSWFEVSFNAGFNYIVDFINSIIIDIIFFVSCLKAFIIIFDNWLWWCLF